MGEKVAVSPGASFPLFLMREVILPDQLVLGVFVITLDPKLSDTGAVMQEARPVVGEKIAVFGQGVIGLLVTAILARSFGAPAVLAVEPNVCTPSTARGRST